MEENYSADRAGDNAKTRRVVIICLTGMPGAGKSTVANSLKDKGFLVITMGDVIREEAIRLNLDLGDANLGKLMIKMRNEMGQGAIAELVIKRIKAEIGGSASNGDPSVVIVDGIRSIAEVNALKRIGDVRLLAIHASADIRFVHMKKRARTDAPLAQNDFRERDSRELSVGISEAIALADEAISNNNLTIKQLRNAAFEIVTKWIDSLMKDHG
jgi:dephospho-CoA kinase